VVAAHAAVTALAGALLGVNGVVGAFCIVLAAVLLVAGAGRGWGPIARELAQDRGAS